MLHGIHITPTGFLPSSSGLFHGPFPFILRIFFPDYKRFQRELENTEKYKEENKNHLKLSSHLHLEIRVIAPRLFFSGYVCVCMCLCLFMYIRHICVYMCVCMLQN